LPLFIIDTIEKFLVNLLDFEEAIVTETTVVDLEANLFLKSK